MAALRAAEVDDLERLASAAYLARPARRGLREVGARAHQAYAAQGDVARAARCAFWIAFGLLNGGELARGGGWVDRAQRLLDEAGPRLRRARPSPLCRRRCKAIFERRRRGRPCRVRQAVQIGDRFRDVEISTLARIGVGRCLIYMGEVDEGVALLDEAMVSVGAEEVSPIAVGDAYCTVIEGCHELFDVRRTQEWTAALSRWCDSQPDLVMYRGQCLVHRAEVMQFHGEWSDALDETKRAADRLADPSSPMVLGAAAYLRAELHRLRGEFADAENAFREANELGRNPQPGLALLRLAQGNVDAASQRSAGSSTRPTDPIERVGVLGPFVEIALAAGRRRCARAPQPTNSPPSPRSCGRPWFRPWPPTRRARCCVAAGRGRERARTSCAGVDDLARAGRAVRGGPHARVLSHACRAGRRRRQRRDGVGRGPLDVRSARRRARPRRGRLHVGDDPPKAPGGLTAREVEVLRLVAKGKTNRAIADELIVSEKTVASHLSHIFTKLDLTSPAGRPPTPTRTGWSSRSPWRRWPRAARAGRR